MMSLTKLGSSEPFRCQREHEIKLMAMPDQPQRARKEAWTTEIG